MGIIYLSAQNDVSHYGYDTYIILGRIGNYSTITLFSPASFAYIERR